MRKTRSVAESPLGLPNVLFGAVFPLMFGWMYGDSLRVDMLQQLRDLQVGGFAVAECLESPARKQTAFVGV